MHGTHAAAGFSPDGVFLFWFFVVNHLSSCGEPLVSIPLTHFVRHSSTVCREGASRNTRVDVASRPKQPNA